MRSKFLTTFSTLILAVWTSSVAANPYYVSASNGSDSNNGLSPQSPWRTLSAVEQRVSQTGADVYLESGSVFDNQTVVVDWGGSPSDWAILGCYKVGVNGQAESCSATDPKPEINGTFELSCAQSRTCAMDNHNAVPSSRWAALVDVKSSYVTVQNLALKDSAGVPIQIGEPNAQRSNFVFEDLEVVGSVNYIALVNHGASRGTIRRITAHSFNRCDEFKFDVCVAEAGWPAGIIVANTQDAYVIIEDNEVYQGFGEGINCFRSSHVVVRGNRVGNIHSNAIYLDNCSNSIVENNITWGDQNGKFNPHGAFAAVAIGQEDFTHWPGGGYDSINNVVRNNLLSGYGSCVWAFQYDRPRELGNRVGFYAYGNTCAAQSDRAVWLEQNIGAANITSIIVENNIFTGNYRDQACSSLNSANIRFDRNLWSSVPAGNCRSGSDIIGDPLMKASVNDLASRNHLNQPQPSDFALLDASPVLRAGKRLDNIELFNSASYVSHNNDSSSCELTGTALSVDYHCVERQDPPSIGAIDRSNYPPKAPQLFMTR